MSFKSGAATAWRAFNNWRKRGMWFRVTVLLLIGAEPLIERLMTPDHVPLINELVWIACRAIRVGSEPKVVYAELHYLHAEKSRQLQERLKRADDAGNINLSPDESKLLKQNTRQANYNELFRLAQREKIIPADITLSQSKRAMLDEALRITEQRFGPEWEDVHRQTLFEAPFDFDGIMLRLHYLSYGIAVILPLPLIPVLPWFILCLTLGFWGARTASKVKSILAVAGAFVLTSVWLYFSAYINRNWEGWRSAYRWNIVGIAVFLGIWAVIAAILGKRLYRLSLKKKCDTGVFISLLLVSCVFLLTPETFFEKTRENFPWGMFLPGTNLLFDTSAFGLYFVAIGIPVLLYTLFLVGKNILGKHKNPNGQCR
ncbi:MAG: hypothetical protein PHV59_05935 [Victivallales bacterium]|nr:hypothetical protein [Victivallales bacterium]